MTDDLKALCERLRSNWAHNDHRDAATAIESLAADKETFRRAMDVCISDYNKARALAATLAGALAAVIECDAKHEFTPYDYLHGNDEVRAVMVKVSEAVAAAREQGVTQE